MAEGRVADVPPPSAERTARIAAMLLGLIAAIVGGAGAAASLFARAAPDFTVVPASLPAGAIALALALLGASGAAETGAHPRLGGAAMLAAAVGGYAAIGVDFGIAPVLFVLAGAVALAVPPEHPHRHRLPALLHPTRG